MNDVKNWLTSKTVVALAIGVLFNVLTVFHVVVPADIVPADIADNFVAIVNSGIALFGVYGRLTATHKLTT